MHTALMLSERPRILVCLPPGPLFARIAGGLIQRQQATHELRLVSRRSPAAGEEAAWLASNGIAGVVGVWAKDGILAAAKRLGIAAVNVSDRGAEVPVPSVVCDNRAVGRLAAEHLIACGFRHLVVVLQGPTMHYAARRWAGLSEVAAAAGVPVVDWRAPQGLRVDWMDPLPKPGSGVFVDSDMRSFELVERCRDAGRAVPGEIGVLGTDDDEGVCLACVPRLSSVATGGRLIGAVAFDLLRDLIAGRAVPRRTEIPPEGVRHRDSTALEAVDDPALAAAVRAIRDRACASSRFGVHEVARAAGLSRRTLELRFRHRFNATVASEIRRWRLRQGLDLLLGTDLKIAAVAARCGFGSADRFAVCVRAATGRRPGALRAAADGDAGRALADAEARTRG